MQWDEGHQFSPATEIAGTFSLVLLAFSGYVKGSRYFADLPVDLSLVGLVGVLLFGINSVLAAPKLPRRMGVMLILLAACLAGLMAVGAPENEYASTKVLDVFLMAPLLIFGGAYLLRTPSARRYFGIGVVILGALALGLARLDPAMADTGSRVAAEGSSTIGTGRAVGAAAMVLVVVALSKRKRWPLLAVAAVFIAATLGVASRGPLLAAAIAVVVAVVFGSRRGRFVRAVVVVLGGLLLVQFALSEGTVNERLTTLNDTSASARRSLWTLSWESIKETPLGIGWGRLIEHIGVIANSEGWVQYPHNIIIEFTVEAGWAAGLALVVVLFLALRDQLSRVQHLGLVESVMLGLLLYAMVNAMVSGDVNSNRGLWVAIGAAFAAGPGLSVAQLRGASASDANILQRTDHVIQPRLEGRDVRVR